jgi:hypothetical protein
MEKETTKHTSEPWKVGEYGSIYPVKEGACIATTTTQSGKLSNSIANENRIVECVNAMAGIDDPKKWVEERKANMYKETLAKIDLNKFNFEGRCKQVEAENEKLKKALGRIYTMDTSFENYINAIVELKQIAGDAIK